ncbi:MAG: hypothetical protein ACJ8FY_21475 [Gemmataceae bacterium]
MLENESLWDVAKRVHKLLAHRQIDHALVGGLAVFLHGYHRNTVDVDLLIRREDTAVLRSTLLADSFQWSEPDKEFRTSSGVSVQFLIAGESEGPGQPAKFPNPADAKFVTIIESLPVLSLSQLIQAKLACGLGNIRRTHKDFADVVELIAIHRLNGSFARFLHKSVRKEFRELVHRAGGRAK